MFRNLIWRLRRCGSPLAAMPASAPQRFRLGARMGGAGEGDRRRNG